MNIYLYTTADLAKCPSLDDDSSSFSRTRISMNCQGIISRQHQIIGFGINLDSNEHTSISEDKLQSITDAIQCFDNATECFNYIEQTKEIGMFIIVSEPQSRDFIPNIPIQENIRQIYILRQSVESISSDQHSAWINEYEKVKQYVYTTFDDLIDDLRKDVTYYFVSGNQCDLHVEKFGESADGSVKAWFHEFIDILCNLSYSDDQLGQLIPVLEQYTTPNNTAVFKQEYRTKGAVYYYTKEMFIYDILNKALRQHNIHLLFKFGFFIKDLYQELKTAQGEFIKDFFDIPVLPSLYRGQKMCEFDIAKLSDDLYVQNTTLFSSSFDSAVSLMFQDSRLTRDSFLQNVLFQIEVDLRKRTAPYAYICKQSNFSNEKEVLFMIGNRFKVRNVNFNETENHYVVKLVLLNDFEPIDLRIATDYSGRRNVKNCLSTLTFQMYYAPLTEFNIIYHELMNLYPSEKWIEAVKIYRYGQYLQWRKSSCCLALKEYNCALNVWLCFIEDKELNCCIDIGHVYTQIAICHRSLRSEDEVIKMNFDHAHRYYQMAYKNCHSEHERTEILNYLANTYAHKMELPWLDSQTIRQYGSMAIEYKQQYIQKILNNALYDRLKVAENLELLAVYCQKMENYDVMLDSYILALDIYRQQDELDRTSINVCIDEIVQIYVKHKNDVHAAIPYQQMRHDMSLRCNEPTEEDNETTLYYKKQRIKDSSIELAKLYAKDHQYLLAFEQLIQAAGLDEDGISDERISTYGLIRMRNPPVKNISCACRRRSIE